MVYYDAVLKKYFTYLSMPINVIGNSSKISVKKIDYLYWYKNHTW